MVAPHFDVIDGLVTDITFNISLCSYLDGNRVDLTAVVLMFDMNFILDSYNQSQSMWVVMRVISK